MEQITIPEAAAMLGLTRQGVWLLVKKKKLKAKRIGKFFALQLTDVENYIINQSSKSYKFRGKNS